MSSVKPAEDILYKHENQRVKNKNFLLSREMRTENCSVSLHSHRMDVLLTALSSAPWLQDAAATEGQHSPQCGTVDGERVERLPDWL